MKNNDLLTIKEFAKNAGVSRQSIYNRLTKDLQPYLQIIDNKKYLNKRALDLFTVKSVNQFTVNIDNSILQVLQEQLSIKDKQIETLNQTIEQLNKRLEESHILIDQQQKLHAAEIKQIEDKSGNWLSKLFKKTG